MCQCYESLIVYVTAKETEDNEFKNLVFFANAYWLSYVRAF